LSKSFETLETTRKITYVEGDPVGRMLYYDERTRVILVYDGNGSGSLFRPDSVRAFNAYIEKWRKGEK
jgi:hypothetical protein